MHWSKENALQICPPVDWGAPLCLGVRQLTDKQVCLSTEKLAPTNFQVNSRPL
jgi:hypothetical protein